MQNLDAHNRTVVSEFSTLVQNAIDTVLRYKLMIAGIFGVFVVIGLAVAMSMPNKYKAMSTLLIRDKQVEIVPDSGQTRVAGRDALELETQRELILSRELARQVINALDLPISMSSYMKGLRVTGGVRSKILNVTYEGRNPEQAAEIVNAHVKAYLETEIAARRAQIESIKKKADDTIAALKETRAKKSKLAQNLRQDNKLIKSTNSEELIYRQISEISSQIPPVESRKFAIQSKLEALHRTESHELVSDIVDSYLIQQLKVEENKRLQEVNLLRSQLGPKNPDLIAARQALAATRKAIKDEIANIQDSLENELLELERQEKELNARLEQLGDRANFQQGKMIKLKELELEEAASQKLLDGLLERYEQIQSKANFLEPKARIVTEATTPESPSGPNRALVLILFFILGGMINTLLILFLELRDTGIKNFAAVRAITNQNPLGIVPAFGTTEPFLELLDKRRNNEALRKIVLNGLSSGNGNTVLVTSSQAREGRSTVSSVLGAYLARSGKRVLLVSIDSLGSEMPFGGIQKDAAGVHELLRAQNDPAKYVRHICDNFDYLPAGRSDFSSSQNLMSGGFTELLAHMKTHYDYVLIDAPPVLVHSGIETIAAAVDNVIVVAQWLKTKPQTLSHALRLLQATASNITGVVLNKVDIGQYKRLNSESDFLLPRD